MLKILIDEEEVVCDQNISIKEEILTTSSTILNNCYPASWEQDNDYSSRFYFPRDYSKCEIYQDDELIFAGIAKNSADVSLNPRYPHFCSLEILDYKALLSEGDTLNFVISDKTVEEAIEQVINNISDYGFVKGVINLTPEQNTKIGAYSTLDKTAYDVFQYFSEITGTKWFTRRIDEKTQAIDFYNIESLEWAPSIEYTREYYEKNRIMDILFNFNTRDYRNKQTILSSKVYASIESVESKFSNGYSTEYITEQLIGKITSILVDGVSKTFATTDEKEIGIYADFYYSKDTSAFTSASTYLQGTEIKITYQAIVKGREVVTNSSEVSRIGNQLDRNGIIARYETRNDVLTSQELLLIGKSYIKFKGKAEITLTVKTYNKDLFKIGQQTYFDAPIDELKTNYMVKSKETKIIQIGSMKEVFYVFTLSSTYNDETAINYFDNQRRKATGNISQGEYIARDIDIEDTANIIFSNLQITEVSNQASNLLESVLEMPFNK